MRCRQAKLRIAASPEDKSNPVVDQELEAHLRQCSACSAEARASDLMKTVLTEAGRVDPQVNINQNEMRQKVERRLGAKPPSRVPSGSRLLTRLIPIAGLAAAATILIMLNSLVPTEPGVVMGYQVALGGVDRELALDDEIICEILHRLGLDEAAVDIMGCEITCDLLIYDLKSREEAQLVAAAFDVMDGNQVTTNVIELLEPTPSS